MCSHPGPSTSTLLAAHPKRLAGFSVFVFLRSPCQVLSRRYLFFLPTASWVQRGEQLFQIPLLPLRDSASQNKLMRGHSCTKLSVQPPRPCARSVRAGPSLQLQDCLFGQSLDLCLVLELLAGFPFPNHSFLAKHYTQPFPSRTAPPLTVRYVKLKKEAVRNGLLLRPFHSISCKNTHLVYTFMVGLLEEDNIAATCSVYLQKWQGSL